MDGKIVFLAIAIVAVGMFALPSTLAMYTGQHEFVNGSNVNCTKCHTGSSGISLELTSGSAHQSFNCSQCHGSAASTYGVGAEVNTSDGSVHAASTAVTCLGCHIGADPDVNTTDGQVNVLAELNQSASAHTNMSATEVNGLGLGLGTADDGACVSCHTKVAVTVPGTLLNTTAGNMTLGNANVDGWSL